MISTEEEFKPASRYKYDSGLPKDFAQIDTDQDAEYYGNWASAQRRVIFSYVEGDCKTTTCDTDEEFREEVLKFVKWAGDDFFGIDPGLNPDCEPWERCNLDHLLH